MSDRAMVSARWSVQRLWLLAAALLLAAAGAVAAPGSTVDLYISPGGADTNPGTSRDAPVKSLRKAIANFEAMEPQAPTRINVLPGTYSGEDVPIKRLTAPLTIQPADPGSAPVFDGKGKGTWLRVTTPGSGMVTLQVSGLTVQNYETVVSVNGDRSRQDGWIGSVQIRNNKFLKIGSLADGQSPSTAAIRFVNTRNSVIENNVFDSIRNVKSCGGLHAIYMAHLSSDNVIRNNRFVDGCGDTIKVRDASNRNRVVGNTFARQEGASLMLDSYCDKQARGDCTKAEGECPSWDNVFENNTVEGGGVAKAPKLVNSRREESDLSGICGKPTSKVRIREAGTSMR